MSCAPSPKTSYNAKTDGSPHPPASRAPTTPEKAALILQELKTLHRWRRYQEGLQTYDRLPKNLKERPDICLMAGRIASALGDTRRANLILARGQLTDGRFEQALKQITLAEKSKGERNVDITYEIHQIKKRVEKELRWIRNQKG